MDTSVTSQTRPNVPELDSILSVPFKVLDDGFVRVVDYMGSDAAIVQAARISYGVGTKHVSEDRGLIRYLMRHRHTTPFEMCEIKLHVRVPMDCWRQWIRHRTANVNEYSTRYSEAIEAAQSTPPDQWRLQSTVNKQGSESTAPVDVGERLTARELEFQRLAREVYQERLAAGVAREQARKDLPLSTYTEAYWKIDLHNLLHFLSLRMDSYAQHEIRSYANTIGHQIVSRWCPITWEAFIDYRVESLSMTRIELQVIQRLLGGNRAEAFEAAKSAGLLEKGDQGWKRNREREELEGKLLLLGLTIPWQYGTAE
jgi:thymidylate synthase (FAD)